MRDIAGAARSLGLLYRLNVDRLLFAAALATALALGGLAGAP